jgi:diadenosine tetraphosphate (Ap4A) HIT family hydrolase
VPSCPFCRIAAGTLDAVVLHEDADVMAFLDIGPVRPGHTQVIPMHERTDITSARHLTDPPPLRYSEDHLLVGRDALERVRAEIAFAMHDAGNAASAS